LKLIRIPLPPLAEQKRIVEKVDELMGLCDRYEAAKQTRDKLRQKLRESEIASLMDAETDEELDAAWAFVRDNWHNLSQHPEDIDSLRQTLLHLAVRGKLVPQNPDDEPAEKLLKVIATKHASDAKKFRKPKNLPSLKDVDKPFELPFGWSWCRFTEIGQLDRGKSKHRPRNDSILYENGSIPLVQTGDVARANGVIETYTALYNNQGLAQSRLWSKGTLCITIAANIGDSAILGFDACFPDSIVGFLPTKPISDSRYFEFFLRTLKSRLEDFAPSTAQKNINLGILDEVLIPLPPLAEQKRIVAKVDELMQLCDQLEASLRQSQQRAESLAASAISHLTI
jgi:type I restriction enzyme S subunit